MRSNRNRKVLGELILNQPVVVVLLQASSSVGRRAEVREAD